jgi:hypothetical protein
VILYNTGDIFPKDSAGTFEVSISNPNGQVDQYGANNYLSSQFAIPVTLPSQFLIIMRTNTESEGYTSWYLTDFYGDTLFKRVNPARNTNFYDTVRLATGCYHLVVTDGGCDGLSNGFYDGTGYLYAYNFAKTIRYTLPHYENANFGCGFIENFSVASITGFQEVNLQRFFDIFPNPSSGLLKIISHLQHEQEATISVINAFGEQVFNTEMTLGATSEIDLSKLPSGLYHLEIKTPEGRANQTIVLIH